ncbi:iron ABC transporter permease [Rhodococcus rhodnii]|uniref:ABC heme uptake porter n=2 Tax=Rhodococcus rhodnii TaxID=38312 RepID=R7WQD4_9NOCA|nr:iron ABC transporter permease [Rhodococcus rhodnii]EOM77531.1 ABC heme uptake porter [Rhodococcus rhodnii LMG 5362]TXG90993.1 iron ABC transporter permease [Rhodococcus rhodnii]
MITIRPGSRIRARSRPGDSGATALARRGDRRSALLTGVLCGALVALLVASLAVGTVTVAPLDAVKLVLGHLVPNARWMSDGTYTLLQDQVVWQFRLPRALLAAVAGAGLALAGALVQAVVHNPLAEPYILGVSAGAGVGAVSVIAAGIGAGALLLGGAAFAGALVATAAVYLLARRGGRLAPTRLILAGVALGALLSAVTSYLTLTTDAQNVFSVMFFLLGSVSAATMGHLVLPAIALAVVVGWIAVSTRSLDALLVGDEQATALGVDPARVRVVALVLAALLTGAVVAVCGGIGFVGLVIPHIARIVVGSSHRRMVPVCVAGGAVFLAAADLVARTAASPTEVPIGIVTAVVGAPFFLWLLRRDDATRAGVER